jgi:predicted XRE-type DNA-binding protein
MRENITVFGSGNVFEDLGLPDPEACLAKANLASRISSVIRARGLTQLEAARITGIPQPKISLLTRGRLEDFSTDRLYRILNKLGVTVSVVLSPQPDWKPGITTVQDADDGLGDVAVAPARGLAV